MPRYRSAIVSVSLLALALAGCSKSAQDLAATSANAGLPALPAALPMQAGPASQLVTAPPVSAPVRRYVDVSRPARESDRYAYLDRASDVEDEIGDAPPDYDYDNNDGVSPWVWETRGGDYRYAERSDDGYRNYYYQPGAEYPYLVRTHDYSYAYAGGALVAIYLLNGALVPPDRYGGYRDQASRYFWRGQQLRHAADERQHQGVIAANWAAQRAQFSAQQANWAASRAQQAEWQAYHARNDPSQQPGWQQEHQQRQQVAQQFAGWQSRGLVGAPPPVLAAAGPRAARQPGVIPANGRPPAGYNQPLMPGAPGFAGPEQMHRHDMPVPQGLVPMAGPTPNNGVLAAAAREQQMAAQREAQRQALARQQQVLASQRLAQAAGKAQQEAEAQRQAAAARQQQLGAHEAAQQQWLASQRAEQAAGRARQAAAAQQQATVAHERELAARQAAQQQQATVVHEHELIARQAARQQENAAREQQLAAHRAAQDQVLAGQRAEQEANKARQQAAASEQAAARQQAQLHAVAAQKQAEVARVQAAHVEHARPEPAHPEPGHGNERRD